VLETVPDLFLTDRVCYLSGLSKKIKVLAHRGGLEFTTEGIVVERILVIVKLVTEAIVGVLEIDYIVIVVGGVSASAGDLSKRVRGVENAPLVTRRSPIPRKGGIEAEEGHLRPRVVDGRGKRRRGGGGITTA
jgi:hypothetical protein